MKRLYLDMDYFSACHKRWQTGKDKSNEQNETQEQCYNCAYYIRLEGVFRDDYGCCTNPESEYDRKLCFEHDGCGHHELLDEWIFLVFDDNLLLDAGEKIIKLKLFYKFCLIVNNSPELNSLHHRNEFDFIVAAGDSLVDTYQQALIKADCDPGYVTFIGRDETEREAARFLGMQVVDITDQIELTPCYASAATGFLTMLVDTVYV